ncbi:MAG: hypothetical protein ABIH42_11000 [Planctomycetota bacterium]
MPKKKQKRAELTIRKEWLRSPVEKKHSTKKGKKGYNRKSSKKEMNNKEVSC